MPRHAFRFERALPALLCALLGFHPLAESDTFWHLTLGRAVLRYGSRSVPEPSAFRAWSEPCVAVEWLWDVFTFGVYSLGGELALSFLPMLFGAGIGYLACRLIDMLAPRASHVLRCLLGVVAVCAIGDLLNVRPNLAFLVLLVLYMIVSHRYVREPARRAGLGWALVGLAHVWAQLHASFVLALPIFVAVVAPEWRTLRDRSELRGLGLVLLGLLATVFTNPSGSHVVPLVLNHSGGDAVLHILDMKPFDWSALGPFGWPLGAALCLLLLLPAWAWLSGARLPLSGLLLAILGVAMTWTARRFAMAWALLLLPLAAAALEELCLRSPRVRQIEWVGLALSACLAVWSFRHADDYYGPMLVSGLRSNAHPIEAARYLTRMPEGTPVLTEYEVGGPLGFWLDGHVRTFVDGRTPMYFDATDLAAARDVMVSPAASARAIARYGARAAVVARDSPLCGVLAEQWRPAVIEARFTTFIPRSDTPAPLGLPGLAPCGPFYLTESACADGGVALRSSVARLAVLHSSRFVSFLKVVAALQCRDEEAAKQALLLLPTLQEARMYVSEYRWYASWAQLKAQRLDAATELIEDGLAHGDPLAVRVLLEPEAALLGAERLHSLLERGLQQMDDNAPAALRARLALVCMAEQDVECARFQGLRALLLGASDATPALLWAAQHHPSKRIRADLRAWLASAH